MRSLLYTASLFSMGFTNPLPSEVLPRDDRPYWPNCLFSLGDSYSSGIGAGKFWLPSDESNVACKRFGGSYPVQLWLEPELALMNSDRFTFLGCSGAQLVHLEKQIDRIYPQRAQLVTLSIGGNDFDFSKVVKACAYNWNLLGGDYDKQCDDALAVAEGKLNDGGIWNFYREKVQWILDNMLADSNSLLFITGNNTTSIVLENIQLTLFVQATLSSLERSRGATSTGSPLHFPYR